MASNWVPGQSGSPKGRALRARSVAELARLIAQEKVEFRDVVGADGGDAAAIEEVTVCTRLERLLRVLWTMSLDGDLRAIRCLLEYMEGRPVKLVAAAVAKSGEAQVSADELAKLLAAAMERVEAWRHENSGNCARSG